MNIFLFFLPFVVGFICMQVIISGGNERRKQRQEFDDMVKKDSEDFKRRHDIK